VHIWWGEAPERSRDATKGNPSVPLDNVVRPESAPSRDLARTTTARRGFRALTPAVILGLFCPGGILDRSGASPYQETPSSETGYWFTAY
jgi:hypothetical protein